MTEVIKRDTLKSKLLNFFKKHKKLILKNKKIKNFFVKNKKVIIFIFIFLFLIIWTLFFWWLSNFYKKNKDLVNNNQNLNQNTEKVQDLDEENLDDSDKERSDEVFEKIKEKQKDENGKEISFDNLGNFWLEINTDNVKIKAPIVEFIEYVDGSSETRLDQGIGHHFFTAFPNKKSGNVVLSGHSWMPNWQKIPARKVFFDLDKLKIGDEVKVNYKNEVFVYKIVEKKITEDEDESILNQSDKPQITLYTCTPKYVDTTKRLVYIGELVK